LPGREHMETFANDGHILDLDWCVDYMILYIGPNLTNCILRFAFHCIYTFPECSKVAIYIQSQIDFSVTIRLLQT